MKISSEKNFIKNPKAKINVELQQFGESGLSVPKQEIKGVNLECTLLIKGLR